MGVISEVSVDVFMNDYEQIRTPDFARIASYVNHAKGDHRNMTQFAETTGIGASTLSRIVNGRSTKPLSKDIIVKIYEARANKEDVVLLDMLARANGMFPRDFAERVKTQDRYAAKRNEEINREHMMKNALIAGVVSSGMTIGQVINQQYYHCPKIPAYIPRRRGNFVIELPPSTDEPPVTYCWTFFLYPGIHDELDEERHLSLRRHVQTILERASGWFVMDAWELDIVKGDKFSFCFVDEAIFNAFVENLQVAKLKTEMTAILMNPITYTVEKEVWLPGTYTRLYDETIFNNPVLGEDFIYSDDEEDTE